MRVSGRVEQDGKVVVGALVRADYASATTDDRGEYNLDNVTPGRQLVWVRVGETFHQLEADLPKDSVITLPDTTPSTTTGGESGSEPPSSGDSGSEPPRAQRTTRRTRNRE